MITVATLTREQVEDLLDNVVQVEKRKQWKGTKCQFCCPIHGENNPSCGVDIAWTPRDSSGVFQVFNCFSCGASGNLAWFLYKSLPDQFKSTAQAAKFLKDRYKLVGEFLSYNESEELPDYDSKYDYAEVEERIVLPNIELAPFRSGKETYKYFYDRGFDKEDVIEYMIGRDVINKTVTMPVFWEDHSLAGIIGRYIDPNRPHNQRFKIYNNFHKSDIIYPLDKVRPLKDTLIVMESILDVIAMRKWGHPNAIAIMGDSLSNAQADLIAERCSRAIDLTDADRGGESFYHKAHKLLSARGVTLIRPQYFPSEGKDPTEWGEIETNKVVKSAKGSLITGLPKL